MLRIQKLKGGLVFLQPGGRTEIEAEECRDRIEDAVCAVKAALNQGGFLAGGGCALLNASHVLDQFIEEKAAEGIDWRHGVRAAKAACIAPFDTIVSNSIGTE